MRQGVPPDSGPRAEAFWFATPAPLLWAVGADLRDAERCGDRERQRRLARVLAGVGAGGALLMPVSPFWLLLAAGAASWWRSRAGSSVGD